MDLEVAGVVRAIDDSICINAGVLFPMDRVHCAPALIHCDPRIDEVHVDAGPITIVWVISAVEPHLKVGQLDRS